jgi:hypothetical protein
MTPIDSGVTACTDVNNLTPIEDINLLNQIKKESNEK